MKWVAWVVLVIGVVFLFFKLGYPDYTYRYRLELTLEVDGKPHTGSSVIEVRWIGGPALDRQGAYSASGHVYGQAPLIDLGHRGVLIASLIGGDLSLPNHGFSARWLGAQAFGNDSSYLRLPQLPHLRGRRNLSSNNWPRLMWLPDPSDRTSAREIALDDIENVFGRGARFTSAFVEITNDPIVFDIDKKLPWYRAWADEYNRRLTVSPPPGQITLSPSMLIGDN